MEERTFKVRVVDSERDILSDVDPMTTIISFGIATRSVPYSVWAATQSFRLLHLHKSSRPVGMSKAPYGCAYAYAGTLSRDPMLVFCHLYLGDEGKCSRRDITEELKLALGKAIMKATAIKECYVTNPVCDIRIKKFGLSLGPSERTEGPGEMGWEDVKSIIESLDIACVGCRGNHRTVSRVEKAELGRPLISI